MIQEDLDYSAVKDEAAKNELRTSSVYSESQKSHTESLESSKRLPSVATIEVMMADDYIMRQFLKVHVNSVANELRRESDLFVPLDSEHRSTLPSASPIAGVNLSDVANSGLHLTDD
jgi:hypothetical protein